jgi:uncharacterized membrane protein YqiK
VDCRGSHHRVPWPVTSHQRGGESFAGARTTWNVLLALVVPALRCLHRARVRIDRRRALIVRLAKQSVDEAEAHAEAEAEAEAARAELREQYEETQAEDRRLVKDQEAVLQRLRAIDLNTDTSVPATVSTKHLGSPSLLTAAHGAGLGADWRGCGATQVEPSIERTEEEAAEAVEAEAQEGAVDTVTQAVGALRCDTV